MTFKSSEIWRDWTSRSQEPNKFQVIWKFVAPSTKLKLFIGQNGTTLVASMPFWSFGSTQALFLNLGCPKMILRPSLFIKVVVNIKIKNNQIIKNF